MSVTHAKVDRLGRDLGNLIEQHERGSGSLEAFAHHADDPIGFMRNVIGFDPWWRQEEIALSIRDNRRTVVRSAHSMGKDAVAGRLALWWVYARGGLVIITSATERQAVGQTFRELANGWRAARDLPGELYTSTLRVNGDDRVLVFTSSNIDALTGWHDPKGVLVIISEGQGERVEDLAYDAAFSNATDELSRVLSLGNPVRSAGRFYQINRADTWNAIAIPAADHPNIAQGRTGIPGGPAPSWPDEVAKEYGKDSAFYTSRVLAEFPTEGGIDSLLDLADIEAAFGRHDKGLSLEGWPLPVLALDVARSLNRDKSVAAIAKGKAVVALEKWRSRDLVKTTDRFLEIEAETRGRWRNVTGVRAIRADPPVRMLELIVDTPGVGGGVVDTIRARGRKVHEYWGWNPARDDKRFANLRAEVYWHLRDLLQDDETALPRDEDLKEELLAMEWSQDAQGRILMLAKDDLRTVLRRSPDSADASVMALAASTGLLRWKAVGIHRPLV